MAFDVPTHLVGVTGMRREAKCFPQGVTILLSGGGANSALEQKIERAIAAGGHAIFSAGLCGGLDPDLPIGSAIIATQVACDGEQYAPDIRWSERLIGILPFARPGILAGTNHIAATPEQKSALRERMGAGIVDMESHIAARCAGRHGLPFAALRVVSDTAEEGLPPAVRVAMTAEGTVNVRALAGSLVAHPWQIPVLIRTGRHANLAIAELLRCFRLIGPGLGCPYLG